MAEPLSPQPLEGAVGDEPTAAQLTQWIDNMLSGPAQVAVPPLPPGPRNRETASAGSRVQQHDDRRIAVPASAGIAHDLADTAGDGPSTRPTPAPSVVAATHGTATATTHEEPMELALVLDDDDDANDAAETHTIDHQNDELLVRIVLEQEPFVVTERGARTQLWDAITRAFLAAGGVGITDHVDVTKRLGVLTLTLFERPQHLTPTLRTMVLTFNERNCAAGFAKRLHGAFLRTLRRHAADDTDGAVVKPTLAVGDANVLRKRAAEDERLLRLVLTHRPFDAGADGKLPVWIQVVHAYNASRDESESVRGLLLSANSAQTRVSSATTALLDPSCSYHAHLSPALRAMLVEFHLLNKDIRTTTGGDTKQVALRQTRRNSSTTTDKDMVPTKDANSQKEATQVIQPKQVVQTKNVVQQKNVTPRSKGTPQSREVHSGQRDDDLFMRIVIKKRPFNAPICSKTKVWDAVAEVYVAATGDPMKNGMVATRRVTTLTQALLKRPESMTPHLRNLILAYHERYSKASGRSAMDQASLETLRTCARGEIEAEGFSVTTPRASCRPSERQKQNKDPDDVPRQLPFDVVKRSEPDRVKAIEDEHLMKLVMEFRPFGVTGPDKIARWENIVDAYNESLDAIESTRGMLQGTKSATSRLGFATQALADSKHPYHAYLTPALRHMLIEFAKKNDSCRSESARRVRSMSSTTSKGSKKASQSQAVESSAITPAARSQTKATPETQAPSMPGLDKEASQVSPDDILLSEVLRVRFKPGEGKAAWQRVAKNVAHVGTAAFASGKRCKHRVKALLTMYRDPAQAGRLGASERDKLRQLDAVLQSANPQLPGVDSAAMSSGRPLPVAISEQYPNEISGHPRRGHSAESREPSQQLPTSEATADVAHSQLTLCSDIESEPDAEYVLPASSLPSRSVMPSLDVRFMQLVLQVRPSSYPIGKKLAAWDHVAAEWKKTAGANVTARFATGSKAMGRAHFLVGVHRDPNHRDHGQLTPELKELLQEYADMKSHDDETMAAQQRQYRAQRKSSGSVPVAEEERPAQPKSPRVTSGSKRKAQGSVAPRADDHDRDARSRRRRVTHSNPEEEASPVSDEANELVFRVTLERQPFHASPCLRRDAWDAVAWELNKQLRRGKRGAFQNGPKVQAHINGVLDRLETNAEAFPVRIRELVEQYHAMQTSPTSHDRPPLPTPSSEPVVSPTSHQTRETTATRAQADHASTSTHDHEERRPIEQAPVRHDRDTSTTSTPLVYPDLAAELAQLRAAIMQLTDKVEAHQSELGQQEIAAVARERALAAAEKGQLLEQFERERHESRAQQHALVELLRAEREAQRRETTALMDAIDRERQDRRDEFVAMANLLSSHVQPQPPGGKQLNEIDMEPDP